MKVNLPVLYNQLEEKNKKILLGTNTDPRYNLYDYGCVPFSLLAAVNYYGHNETIESLQKKIAVRGGWVEGGLYAWGTLSKIWPEITEKTVKTPQALTDEQVAEIKSALDRGFPVLIEVDYKPQTVAVDMHFLNLVDYDKNDENNMTGADPLGGKLIPMKAYFSWAKFGIRKIIERYTIISGPVPGVVSVTPPVVPENPPAAEAPPVTPSQPDPVPSSPQPNADTPEKTLTPDTTPEPLPPVQPDKKPTEPQTGAAADTKMAEVLTSVVDYLEMEKKPYLVTFEDVRRVIAGIKSVSSDYWGRKEAAEKKFALAEPTIQSLNDKIGILEGELTRQSKVNQAHIDALESSVQNPRNLRRQFDTIYNELKLDHDKRFNDIITLRNENTLLKRELEIALNATNQTQTGTPSQETINPLIKSNQKPVSNSLFQGIKKFFTLTW